MFCEADPRLMNKHIANCRSSWAADITRLSIEVKDLVRHVEQQT